MADNVTLPGTGTVVAADDISSVWYQRIKVTDGTADSTTALTVSSRNAALVEGEVAHNAADAGNPQKVGGQARTTNPTRVADADRVNFIADTAGRQVVVLNQVRDLIVQQHTNLTNNSETTILTAGATGVFHDITKIVLSNSSSSDLRVDIRDATAGSVVAAVFLAALGGGYVLDFPVPFKQSTAANNWTAQSSVNTTGIYITVQGVKNI